MRRWLLTLLIILVYALHQDVWHWQTARPIVFGVLPIGLAYHAVYSIAAAGIMWLLVRYAWPEPIEVERSTGPGDRR